MAPRKLHTSPVFFRNIKQGAHLPVLSQWSQRWVYSWWCDRHMTSVTPVKPGFHYPSWRPELTARVDGWPVSIARQCDGPSTRLMETRTRQHGPCWRVMETGHPFFLINIPICHKNMQNSILHRCKNFHPLPAYKPARTIVTTICYKDN